MTLTHPRLAPRRGVPPASSWWGKAWQRSVEESAYAVEDLRRGRSLARAGAVGAIDLSPGGFVAAVEDRGDAFTVSASVETFDETSAHLFVEVVAQGAGRVAALLAGELPLALVEATEEVGVELIPYAGELGWSCSCDAWMDPCPHALAVAVQVGWLLHADPLVLLHLRGLPREELLARVHQVATGADDRDQDHGDGDDEDLETGLDAALRAAALLADPGEDRGDAPGDQPTRG